MLVTRASCFRRRHRHDGSLEHGIGTRAYVHIPTYILQPIQFTRIYVCTQGGTGLTVHTERARVGNALLKNKKHLNPPPPLFLRTTVPIRVGSCVQRAEARSYNMLMYTSLC